MADLEPRTGGLDERDRVVLWGDGRDGGPTAQDWAEVAGTISYEVVTRLGARVPRTYVDSERGETAVAALTTSTGGAA